MKKFFARKENDEFIFENEELIHFNVVRCSVGEKVLCFGGDEFDYLCKITQISKKQARAKIVEKVLNTKNPKVNIAVFQGLVKGDKTDLIVQKLTELGVSSLYLFQSEFTIAKPNQNKTDRLIRVSTEACKQCGRSVPLNIENGILFEQMLEKLKDFDIVLFANEKNTIRSLDNLKDKKNIAIIVGSEGGFSDYEIEKIYNMGAINFGLGERILRAETACIATSSIVGFLVGV